jgi:hypothetical protein
MPGRGKGFFSPASVSSSEAHPASCPIGTVGSFPRGKARPGRDADHSPHVAPRSRMSRSHIPLPLGANFAMRDSFTALRIGVPLKRNSNLVSSPKQDTSLLFCCRNDLGLLRGCVQAVNYIIANNIIYVYVNIDPMFQGQYTQQFKNFHALYGNRGLTAVRF